MTCSCGHTFTPLEDAKHEAGVPGNTIIICPSCYKMRDLDWVFWEDGAYLED